MWGFPPQVTSLRLYQMVGRWMGGFPLHNFVSTRWQMVGKKVDGGIHSTGHISTQLSDVGKWMRKFSPHLSIGIRWRKERWMGGFPPHLSISIRWREQMWMGGFPHIFSSVSYREKDGGWGDSRTPLRSIRWPERWWTGGIPPTCLRKNPYMYFSIRWGKEV